MKNRQVSVSPTASSLSGPTVLSRTLSKWPPNFTPVIGESGRFTHLPDKFKIISYRGDMDVYICQRLLNPFLYKMETTVSAYYNWIPDSISELERLMYGL